MFMFAFYQGSGKAQKRPPVFNNNVDLYKHCLAYKICFLESKNVSNQSGNISCLTLCKKDVFETDKKKIQCNSLVVEQLNS